MSFSFLPSSAKEKKPISCRDFALAFIFRYGRELTRPLDLKVPPRCPEVADLGARRGLQRPAAAAGAEAKRAAVRRQEA